MSNVDMDNSLNMVQLLKDRLNVLIKQAVTDQLVKEELVLFEGRLREIIRPMVEKVSIDSIETIADVKRMREELHVFLHWID